MYTMKDPNKEDKPVSMKPDKTVVDKLRELAEEAKDDVVLFPQATFKQAVDDEIPNSWPFLPVNLGALIQFVADMAE